MAISQEVIQKVRDKIEILDLISERVHLKKRGQNYLGLCPFHSEKTPSFNVSPAKNMYKCFGCGRSGDGITFIEESKSMTFIEAVKDIAKYYSIEISTSESEIQQSKEPLYIALKFAFEAYEAHLYTPEGKDALYYVHNRGYSRETIKRFGIGLSFKGYNGLKDLAEKRHYKADVLEAAGLLKRGETSVYDTFRDRIMFPVRDVQGRVIAFTARAQGSDTPKYINSPTTAVYSKSDILYGLFEAKDEIRAKDECYLLEGATDVVAVSNAGILNSVASLGTALTALQCKLIKKFTHNLTVIFDGDSAGIKAAIKGIDIALESGLNVNAVLLPEKTDPDELIKTKGAQAFTDLLSDKLDFIEFKASIYQGELSNIATKANAVNEIVTTVCKISDPIKRSLYIKKLAVLMDVPERDLMGIEKNLIPRAKDISELTIIQTNKQTELAKIERSFTFSNELEILRILLLYGAKRIILKDGLNIFESDFTVSEYIYENCEIEIFDNSILSKIYYICMTEFEYGRISDLNYLLSSDDNDVRQIAFELSEKSEQSGGIDWSVNGIQIESDFELSCNSLFEIITRLKYRYISTKERKALAQLITTGDEKIIPELDNLNRLKIELVKNIKYN